MYVISQISWINHNKRMEEYLQIHVAVGIVCRHLDCCLRAQVALPCFPRKGAREGTSLFRWIRSSLLLFCPLIPFLLLIRPSFSCLSSLSSPLRTVSVHHQAHHLIRQLWTSLSAIDSKQSGSGDSPSGEPF